MVSRKSRLNKSSLFWRPCC